MNSTRPRRRRPSSPRNADLAREMTHGVARAYRPRLNVDLAISDASVIEHRDRRKGSLVTLPPVILGRRHRAGTWGPPERRGRGMAVRHAPAIRLSAVASPAGVRWTTHARHTWRGAVSPWLARLITNRRSERVSRRSPMHWLAVNWFWIVIGVAFVALHLFGHGGHGGHGSHRAEDSGARSFPPADDHNQTHVH